MEEKDIVEVVGAAEALVRITGTGVPSVSLLRDEIALAGQRLRSLASYTTKHVETAFEFSGIDRVKLIQDVELLARAAVTDDLTAAFEHLQDVNRATFRLADVLPQMSDNYGRGSVDRGRSTTKALVPRVREAVKREEAARSAEARLDEIVEGAKRTADDIAESAGQIGEANLSEAFESMADAEGRATLGFRIATFVLAALAVCSPFIIEALPSATAKALLADDQWTSLAARLIVAAGIAGAATYSARQAGNHRRASLWARSIATQLRSLNAYVSRVDSQEAKDAIRELMARRMMSEPPQGARQADAEVGSAELLQIALEAVRKSPQASS